MDIIGRKLGSCLCQCGGRGSEGEGPKGSLSAFFFNIPENEWHDISPLWSVFLSKDAKIVPGPTYA